MSTLPPTHHLQDLYSSNANPQSSNQKGLELVFCAQDYVKFLSKTWPFSNILTMSLPSNRTAYRQESRRNEEQTKKEVAP